MRKSHKRISITRIMQGIYVKDIKFNYHGQIFLSNWETAHPSNVELKGISNFKKTNHAGSISHMVMTTDRLPVLR